MERYYLVRAFKNPWFSMVTLALSLVFVQGCAQYRLDMKDSDPAEKPYKSRMMHAFAWGLLYKPQQVTTGCDTETGINDVIVKSNYLYHLVSVLTVGIWMPIEVEYRCQAGAGRVIPFTDN